MRRSGEGGRRGGDGGARGDGRRRRTLATAACAALALALAPAPDDAFAAATWDGECRIAGVTTFDQPIGGLPAPVTYADRGTGTCTGTLDGRRVEDAPVELEARGEGTVGCLGGTSVMPGTITFTAGTADESDDVSHRYVGRAVGVFPNFVSLARGAESGRSIAYVTMLGRSDPSQADACRDGTLRSAAWDALTRTLGPNEG